MYLLIVEYHRMNQLIVHSMVMYEHYHHQFPMSPKRKNLFLILFLIILTRNLNVSSVGILLNESQF